MNFTLQQWFSKAKVQRDEISSNSTHSIQDVETYMRATADNLHVFRNSHFVCEALKIPRAFSVT